MNYRFSAGGIASALIGILSLGAYWAFELGIVPVTGTLPFNLVIGAFCAAVALGGVRLLLAPAPP